MSTDPIAICELLVGLPDVAVLDVTDSGNRMRVTVKTRTGPAVVSWVWRSCGGQKPRHVELTDLPCFGMPAVLVWRRTRWVCQGCGSFTEQAPGIAAPRLRIIDRAARWATVQVGRQGRSSGPVGAEVAADWAVDGKR